MPNRRTVALILIGAFLGVALSAAFFFIRPTSEPDNSGAKQETVAPIPSEESLQETRETESKPLDISEIKGDGRFMGSVRSTDGQPVADARVRIWLNDASWSASFPTLETKTDTKGRFTISGVRTDLSVTLYAYKSGFAVASVKDAESHVETEIVLENGNSLAVYTIDSSGDPLAETRIYIAGASLWPSRYGKTDVDGDLLIEGLLPGDYELLAVKGNLSALGQISISPDSEEENRATLDLRASNPVQITVKDEANRMPLEGAFVAVSSIESPVIKRVATTDKQGTVSFIVPDGEAYQAMAFASGFLNGNALGVSAGNHVSIFLKRGATLSGVIQDNEGAPIEGATLRVVQTLGASRVDFQASGGEIFSRALLKGAAGGWPRLIEIESGHHIPGPTQLPLPIPVRENKSDEASSNPWEKSDSSGRFLLDGLPLGRTAIFAKHPEYVMAQSIPDLVLTANAQVENILVRMHKGSHVSARVVGGDDYPVGAAEVSVFDAEGQLIAEQLSASDGYTIFTGMPAMFRIEASSEGFVPTFVNHNGRLGDDVDIRIRLAIADKTLTGRVKDDRGNDIGGVPVIARARNRGQIQVLSTVSRPDGRFELPGAGPGFYNVSANAEDRGAAVATSVNYEQDIKLVLDSISRPSSNVEHDSLSDNRSNTPLNDDPLETDNLGVVGGASRNTPRRSSTSHYSNTLPTVISETADPASTQDERNDDGLDSAIPEEVEPEVVATQYGEAESLPVTGPPPGKGGLPITLGGEAGKVIVTSVVPGSRVQVAGLTKGSRLLSVDGKQVKSPSDARRAIQGTIGSVLMLEVNDRGEIFTLVVQRERAR